MFSSVEQPFKNNVYIISSSGKTGLSCQTKRHSKTEGFDSCDRLGYLVWHVWPWNWTGDLLGIVISELKFDSSLLSANSGIGPKLPIFLPLWPPNWTDGQKTTVHLFYASRSFVQHFIAICKLKLELPSEIGDFFSPVQSWNLTDKLEHCQKGVTDGRTKRRTRAFTDLLRRN